jgi:ATP-binding cassette, subfamily B, bacterial MsbA
MSESVTSNRELYLRLLGYVKPYWKMFALAMLTMVGAASTEPLLPAVLTDRAAPL